MTSSEHHTESPAQHIVERWTSRALRLGVWLSASLMIVGLIAAFLTTSTISLPAVNPTIAELFAKFFSRSIDAVTIMYAGLLLLMLTPFFRVFIASIGFAVEKDSKFVVVSLIVLSMLIGELVYSLH